jgi:hypothetical protein
LKSSYPGKNTKISTLKLNLKVQNIYITPLLKSKNTFKKPCFETAYLAENVKKCCVKTSQKCHYFWATSSLQKKSGPIGKILPNLVTQEPVIKLFLTLFVVLLYCDQLEFLLHPFTHTLV